MLVARSCASVGGKDVVGEAKGVDVMGVRVAGSGEGQRERRKEVEVNPKYRSLGHDVSNLFSWPLKKAARVEKTESGLGCAS